MKRLLMAGIRFYRKNISPARPPTCRFTPTCSAYALEAVETYGALRGGLLALRRLSKCHPLHTTMRDMYDPVPPAKEKRHGGGTP